MRNKPSKLYFLVEVASGEPYRQRGQPKDFSSKGKATKWAKRLYERSATLYRVTRCEMVPRDGPA